MDEIVVTLRRERAIGALAPLFFVSGATGLVYQTIWGRELHLVFGTSTFAIATVLSAFMAGLALGGALAARWADRLVRPLAAYGVLEVGIGLCALAFPAAVELVAPVYLDVWRASEPGPVAFGLLQLVLVGSLLVIPTALMGATLPLLARFATDRLEAAGDRVGWLYAVNTTGAVFGTWLAGFVALPALGLWATTAWAAAANLLLGVVALAVSAWARGDEAVTPGAVPDPHVAPPDPRVLRAVAAAAGLAGFASLVYEVAWFRVLGLMLGASVYAFSTMLLAFLVGIAVGGRLGGPWGDRLLHAGGAGRVLQALALVQVSVGALSLGMMHLYRELPFWYVWLFDAFGAEHDPTLMWVVSTLLAGIVMTPPAVLMGVAFPLAVRGALGRPDDVGGAVGRIYAWNTLGGVFGAALAGFVLLPWLAVTGTVQLAVLVNLIAAVAAWSGLGAEALPALRGPWGRRVGAGVGVVALLGVVVPPAWDPLLMTAGMYKYVSSFEDHSRSGIRDYAVDQYDLLYYREGLSSVVTVARNRDSGNIWLANNGKVDASTTVDMPTQVMVSLLPMQFVEDPEDVLVIGLASGITAGAVALVDDVGTLDVVELEPAIREAAVFFADQNHHVLDDPRTNLVVNDGRNHVLLSAPGTWDVVVSEPSNPWLTGVSNLFTREFFELGKSRLKEGGVWSQWVQLYGMDDDDLRSLVGTFADVFPHVLLYAAAEDADLVLVGSERPLVPTWEAASSLWRWEAVVDELAVVALDDPAAILATLLTDRDGVLELAGGIARNTDDNMRIEYAAPLNLHRDTQSVNVPLLYRHAEVPVSGVRDADHLDALADAYADREDPDRAIDAKLLAGLVSEEGSPARAQRVETAFDWYVTERVGDEREATPSERAVLEREFLEQRLSRVRALME